MRHVLGVQPRQAGSNVEGNLPAAGIPHRRGVTGKGRPEVAALREEGSVQAWSACAGACMRACVRVVLLGVRRLARELKCCLLLPCCLQLLPCCLRLMLPCCCYPTYRQEVY